MFDQPGHGDVDIRLAAVALRSRSLEIAKQWDFGVGQLVTDLNRV